MPFLVIVQLLTFVPFHVKVVDCPDTSLSGALVIVSDGVRTLTVAVAGFELPPLALEQVTEYVEVVDGLTDTDPDVALPVEKPPAETQDVALVEFQVSVDDWPSAIVEGVAVSDAVGCGISVQLWLV